MIIYHHGVLIIVHIQEKIILDDKLNHIEKVSNE